QESNRGRGLNPARGSTPAITPCVFCHIDRSPSVFATDRESLQNAHCDERIRCGNSDRGIIRQQADNDRSQPHDRDGHEKSPFAAVPVAEATERQRSERADGETRGKRQQRENVALRGARTDIKMRADDRGERSENEEIVPLEYGARARCREDKRNAARFAIARQIESVRRGHVQSLNGSITPRAEPARTEWF